MERKKTKQVRVRDVLIGGSAPISVQSMTNTNTEDKDTTLRQINELAKAGCDIVRFTVNTPAAAENVAFFRAHSSVPLVADIHFDAKLAMICAENGIDKIRINPGNIGDAGKVKALARLCEKNQIPIRIGVNSGSVKKDVLAKYGAPTAQALAESALEHVRILEDCSFGDIVISAKSSDVITTIQTYRILSASCDYPLHLGVTESGTPGRGTLKSAVGIGSLLADGIGDTVRVSLTGDPVCEVSAARNILAAVGYTDRINIVSCPTCGRTKYNLVPLVNELEKRLADVKVSRPFTVAVMGCVVNGPGEAKNADIGIAGGINEGILFIKGEPVR
ncbi:MAG TPA: flavodoxin-dependent (E)-4-hydroxy-3-methylbut-2-enyl-diphosphate synthase, partial [Bacillota bacterium]|nr:flavodoxin-dependent (E)-4-hydroxy-3-methylbut-2-enyl-diphosphate synthase [Bacillota bacterium]